MIDRFWFRSISFRAPSGVPVEIATMGPGFAIDADADVRKRPTDEPWGRREMALRSPDGHRFMVASTLDS